VIVRVDLLVSSRLRGLRARASLWRKLFKFSKITIIWLGEKKVRH